LRTFAAEWPDPLNSCPGYEPPTGLPITLTLGRFVVTKLESFSVEQIETDRGTETLEACGFDGSTFVDPDAATEGVAREVLRAHGTAVVVPRRPLERGATYHAVIGANGRRYDWKFTINP